MKMKFCCFNTYILLIKLEIFFIVSAIASIVHLLIIEVLADLLRSIKY